MHGLTTGGLIRDDARVFALDIVQYEVIGWTGATVTIRQWTTADALERTA